MYFVATQITGMKFEIISIKKNNVKNNIKIKNLIMF